MPKEFAETAWLVVNTDLKDCVNEYRQDGVVHDYAAQSWLGQILSGPNDQDLIEMLWYKTTDGIT